MPRYCWWYWRIYMKQDYSNVERGLYVKIIHVNYDILLIDCDLELFTFADNCIKGFKHMKHHFVVNYAFLLPFCVTLAFVCV